MNRVQRPVSTDDLRKLNEHAIENRGHRSLEDGFWGEVDPDGVHLITQSFPFGQNQDGPCHRTMFMVKMRDGSPYADYTPNGLPFCYVMLDVEFGKLQEILKARGPCPPVFEF